MKKGEPSRPRDNNKNQHEASPRDKDHMSLCSTSVIKEIKMTIGEPSTGGLFRSHKKVYQRQVNSVHRIPILK